MRQVLISGKERKKSGDAWVEGPGADRRREATDVQRYFLCVDDTD